MASTITVQNLRGPATGANANKVIIPAGQTLDASAGFVPPAGSVVNMGCAKHSQYASSNLSNTWVEAYAFSISGITAGNKVYLNYSVNDLVESGNHVTFRIRRGIDGATVVQWSRLTAGNGSWRGIRSDATGLDDDTSGGTRTYYLDTASDNTGMRYINYNSSYVDAASFLTWWEIAQ